MVQTDAAADAPGTADAACANCFQPLPVPRPPFCPHCGQETTLRPPRVGEFIQQFGGAFVSTEGALWRTLRLLLFRPGELTRQYLAGRRKHYVLPLRLYLTISVVVLLLLRALSDVHVDVGAAADELKSARQVSIEFGIGRAGLKEGQFFCTGLPQWLCQRLQRRLDLDPKSMQREVQEFGGRFVANLGAAMFVLLPLFGLWLKLAWIDRHLRYTEHLVMALHLHAFWFVMFAAVLSDLQPLQIAVMLYTPVYTLLAARRVYGGRWWLLLPRAGAVALLYLLSLVAVMSFLAVYTLLV